MRALFRVDQDGRPLDAELPRELERACFDVLRGWDWPARPAAVVWVPSRSRPSLVRSLALSIAHAGRLQALGPLGWAPPSDDGPPRSANSAYRVRDIAERFSVSQEMAGRLRALGGPVLLVDDYVDTRWTLTLAGRLLRRAGAEAVLPFALASQA